ncbi:MULTISPECIES: hypothetical protein [unclassified Streptomyces]|uniref:hypothetical protein n=1 Tax=unclassified Streptomyces TaxID=2593676 RepID=UPI00344FF485
MYASELELRVRYEELRREAAHRRLVREATHGTGDAAHLGDDAPEGRVRGGRTRRGRLRRATV